MTKRIKHMLANNKVQRVLYFVGILFWTILWYIDDLSEYPNKTLDFGWAIPTVFLLFQVVFNNRTMWIVLFVIFLLYSASILTGCTYGLINSIRLTVANTGFYIAFVVAIISFIWVFYYMQPKRFQASKHVL